MFEFPKWGLLGSTGLLFFLFAAANISEPLGSVSGNSEDTDPTTIQQVRETFGRVPLSFEANRGQTAPQVRFLSRGVGYTLFLTPTEVVFSLVDQAEEADQTVLRMQLAGANPDSDAVGLDQLPGKNNYLLGADPAKWRTNIPTYARVKYPEVYPGIDLIFYGKERQLEYDFVISPGSDPKAVRLSFEGVDRLELDARGDLVLDTGGGQVRLERPFVYQQSEGVKREVSAAYLLGSNAEVGFQLGSYDTARPLVIDPVFLYSTHLGGSGDDFSGGIAVDAEGNVYVGGLTTHTIDFPTTEGAYQTIAEESSLNAFVMKLNASGSAIVYSTFLGGEFNDGAVGIAVDEAGNAYLTGFTHSPDFPATTVLPSSSKEVTQGPRFHHLPSVVDIFVAKLNPSGSELVYSTRLAGSDADDPRGIAVDAEGHAYVTGFTSSADFPTANALQPTFAGGEFGDAFVSKLNPTGSGFIYSTYLGGESSDSGFGIAVDTNGNAYVTGSTDSSDFPMADPIQPTLGGQGDAFVSKLNPAGSALTYSTYLGGSFSDDGLGIAVDPERNAYITGVTISTDFPTATPLQPARAGGSDAFVAKLNPSGSALVYSTYLGGTGSELRFGPFLTSRIGGIAVDPGGNAYVTGATDSIDFPIANPLQSSFAGGEFGDSFLAKLNSTGTTLIYSTYLGGQGSDVGLGIAVDPDGDVYVTGFTESNDFPTANFQIAKGRGFDGFVTKIASGKLYFAQFGNGQGVTSETVLTNPSASEMGFGRVDFLDDDGLPLPVGTVPAVDQSTSLLTGLSIGGASVDFSIPPLGSATISSDGQGDLVVGSGVVTSDRDLGGVTRFTIPGIGIAGVGASQALNGFITPVRRSSGGINTGIAIHNTESQSVSLDISLRSSQGEQVANGTKTIEGLPPGGHLAQFIDELFPLADTSDFEGTLVVQASNGTIAATALELGSEKGQFTTLPVTPLQPSLASASDSSLSAPLFVGKGDVNQDTGIGERLSAKYSQLPISFELNQGQADPGVDFLSRGRGFTLFLSAGEGVVSLGGSAVPTLIRMQVLGSNPDSRGLGVNELSGRSHYFIGDNPKSWHREVRNYARVKYEDVYPGVDLVYHGNQTQLEYDFIVAPGADPEMIRLGFQGIDSLEVDSAGDLVLYSSTEQLRLHKPVIYQELGRDRQQVSGGYVLEGGQQIGFHLGSYDPARPLVLDPVLTYSVSFGSFRDRVEAVAVDPQGNAYLTGSTRRVDFPTTPDALQGWSSCQEVCK